MAFWLSSSPKDIIDIANEIVHELETNCQEYPLTKGTLIELLFILFCWMYKNKWTDHKLVKRASENDSKENFLN